MLPISCAEWTWENYIWIEVSFENRSRRSDMVAAVYESWRTGLVRFQHRAQGRNEPLQCRCPCKMTGSHQKLRIIAGLKRRQLLYEPLQQVSYLRKYLRAKGRNSEQKWRSPFCRKLQALKLFWAQWNSLVLEEGVLKKVLKSNNESARKMQIGVPRSKILEILRYLHDRSSGGHLGVTKTESAITILWLFGKWQGVAP